MWTIFFALAMIVMLPRGSQADELADRIKDFWGPPRAFLCRGAFPAKFDPLDGEQCGDGDMTLFNGLLCLSGEKDFSCNAVKQSQGTDGRWWRSPRRVGQEHPQYMVSFSPDQALGVLSYVLAKHDTAAFDSWLGWITAHRQRLSSGQIKGLAK